MNKNFAVCLFTVGIAIGLIGCGSIHVFSIKNQPLTDQGSSQSRDSDDFSPTSRIIKAVKLPNQAFLGIAVSGGGSRAANFTAAVFENLNDLGFLDHATMISCVSGGCLPTAYYRLHKQNMNWVNFRSLMRTNFFSRWALTLFYPHNLVRNFLTDWDRSDAMADIFDDILYQGATFNDIKGEYPRILINSTHLGGNQFIFSSDMFRGLGSRLDTYPIANAVMASGAFPSAFNNVTLADYTKLGQPGIPEHQTEKVDHYWHLFDGGPIDNLGIVSIIDALDSAVSDANSLREPQLNGCMLILVDAYPGKDGVLDLPSHNKSDPRWGIDFLIDRNVINATDTMLKNNREKQIFQLRNSSRDPLAVTEYWPYRSAYWSYRMNVNTADNKIVPLSCDVWHITFERLTSIASDNQDYLKMDFNDVEKLKKRYSEVRQKASSAETHYKLTSPDYDNEELQDALYNAARLLIRDDIDSLTQACHWFKRMNLPTKGCKVAEKR